MAHPSRLALAIALAELADRGAEYPGLGHREPRPFRLIIAADRDEWQRLTRGRLPMSGAGAALPGLRTIIVRGDLPNPRQVLRHEMAHLVLHDELRTRVPRWFDEGYATIAAGEWNRLAALGLHWRVATGRTPDFRTLDGALQSGADSDAAYGFAATAVGELARRNPEGSLDPLMARLAAGTPFEEAVLATTGLALGRFEVTWQRAVRRRYGLVTWLAAGGLWVILASLPFLLLWPRRRRDAVRREALDAGWVIPGEDELSLPPDDRPAAPPAAP